MNAQFCSEGNEEIKGNVIKGMHWVSKFEQYGSYAYAPFWRIYLEMTHFTTEAARWRGGSVCCCCAEKWACGKFAFSCLL